MVSILMPMYADDPNVNTRGLPATYMYMHIVWSSSNAKLLLFS